MPRDDRLGKLDPHYDAMRVATIARVGLGRGQVSPALIGVKNLVALYDSGQEIVTYYPATQAGLVSALALAGNNDSVWLPSRIIVLTTGIVLLAGAALLGIDEKAALSFSSFSGTAITMAANSICYNFRMTFTSNGVTAIGVDARFSGSKTDRLIVEIAGGSTTRVGVWAGVA